MAWNFLPVLDVAFALQMTTGPLHYFSRGAESLIIDLSMHVSHRAALIKSIISQGLEGDAIILAGGGELPVYNTDTVWDFKQESNFQYLFGVKEPGCFGVIRVAPAASILFIPRLPQEYAQWMGAIKPPQWFKETYLVDDVYFVDEMESVLRDVLGVQSLRWYDFTNLDSGLSLPQPVFDGSDNLKFISGPAMAHALNELRVVKTEAEIVILQYTNDVTSRSHISTMQEVFSKRLPEVMAMEHFAETNFRYRSALEGCARVGYHCIACSGLNNAVLHYGHAGEPNNESVAADSLRLIDMGAEYHCYTADVTVTFPTSGRFSAEQKIIYSAVWEAVLAVERAVKPNVDYRDMHRLSHRVMLEQLVKTTNLFTTSNVDELLKHNVAASLSPHGLGHSIGTDVHCVGGYLPGEQKDKTDLSIKGLRFGRPLKQNMVITVEPGLYFIEYLLDELKSDPVKSKLVNWQEMNRFKSVGGVRIEDNIVITENGCRVLTDVPRTVEDVEAVMTGRKDWQVGKNYRHYSH